MRWRIPLKPLVCAVAMATPAAATLVDTTANTYSGLCQMTQTCTSEGACGVTPALGDMLLVVAPDTTWMGRRDDDLAPVDHYATLQDALPLPRLDTRRRTFLTDLPPDGTARRFAVRIQTLRPETGDPVLRPQYFVLTCEAL